MTRTTQLILVAIFICALTAVGVIGSIKVNVQDNQNSGSECEQACTRTYQECMGASNANRAQCQRDMQNCRANCRKPSPSPSPDVSPSVEPTATPSPTP
ncbi:MAG TPA: hypothetical protein VHP99_00635 [Pyrinomonadaceae bacterium]|nr:hypothetical protein [Pyrinomonadaceae bacterium]